MKKKDDEKNVIKKMWGGKVGRPKVCPAGNQLLQEVTSSCKRFRNGGSSSLRQDL